jgi:hypothetical protein
MHIRTVERLVLFAVYRVVPWGCTAVAALTIAYY